MGLQTKAQNDLTSEKTSQNNPPRLRMQFKPQRPAERERITSPKSSTAERVSLLKLTKLVLQLPVISPFTTLMENLNMALVSSTSPKLVLNYTNFKHPTRGITGPRRSSSLALPFKLSTSRISASVRAGPYQNGNFLFCLEIILVHVLNLNFFKKKKLQDKWVLVVLQV